MGKGKKIGHLTTENLVKVLDALVSTPNWKKAMARIGASEGLAFTWRARCVADMKANDTSSIFFLEYRGCMDWWVNFCGRCRTESVMLYESVVRDQALNGIQTAVLGPDQKPIWQPNLRYLHRDDDFIRLSEGLDAGADVEWYRYEHDARGNPVPLLKTEQIPAPLRLRVLEQDTRYISRQEIDQHVQVTATAKPFERLPGETRPDVTRLRQLAAMPPEERRKEIGASGVALDVHGRRTMAVGTLPSARDDNLPVIEKPSPFAAPYQPPEAKQNPPNAPRPSYARPTQRLDVGERLGRGEIPDGGVKVA
jgi:hypothetical protein